MGCSSPPTRCARQSDCIASTSLSAAAKGTLHQGNCALDTATSQTRPRVQPDRDGALYWEMGGRLWQIENGSLTKVENPLRSGLHPAHRQLNNGVTEQTAWQGKVQLDGPEVLCSQGKH